MANTQFPKSLYRVYECRGGMFDYDTDECLFEHDNLGHAHGFAYEAYQKDNTKAYTIIQPYDESCRGHYGIKSYNYEEE
jgi:hypothetical protein